MIYSVGTNTEEVIEVEENIIAFEEVQVAVLDCRSGRPLANKKVKRIVVKQDDAAIIDVEFDRTVDHALTVELADALKKLGFDDADVKKGYKKYWAARDSSAKAADAAGEPFPVFEARVIDEYKRHRATDDNGILTLQLPRVFFNGHSISVEVGFWDFPVFLEAVNDDPRVQDLAPEPIRRDGVDIGGSVLLTDLGYNGTKFDIVWTGREQSTDWNGNWGWEARRVSRNAAPIAPASGGMVSATYFLNSIGLNAGAGNQEVDMATEFKVSETIILKNNQAEVDMDAPQNVSILDSSLFSMFYVKGTNNTPFVLYGMEWCQPVWDGIEDPQGELVAGSSNENVYIQNPEYAHLNMHVVTMAIGNSRKTYGTTRHGADRYDAVDLHTITGRSELFAVHQGSTEVRDNALSAAGRYVILSWNDDLRRIRYLHMHSISVLNNENVLPGTILGIAGRTGNFSPLSARNEQNDFEPDSQYPDHCHLDDGYRATGSGILSNRNELDPFNQKCLPNYSFPLLFPCACTVSEEDSNPEGCNFSNNSFVSTCWAVAELKCPYMNGESVTDRRIQAQLKFLNYYLGNIDGVFGPIPTSLSTASGSRRAIYRFKEDRGLLSSDQKASFVLGHEDLIVLNQDAPVIGL